MIRSVRKATLSYEADADDELSFKIGQFITVIAIEDNGWAEGILEDQWVGWFPIDLAVEDESQIANNASLDKIKQLRLDNLFKNADLRDGTVYKKEALALSGLEKLQKRNSIILEFIECQSVFISTMNAWISEVESNHVFSLLSKDQAVSLLEAIDDVINFHQVLLGSLDVVRSADYNDQMFGGYFLDFISFFSEVYLKLKSLLPKIVTFVISSNACTSQDKDTMAMLQFSADIHLPVQHVYKMVNLTRRILNVTPLDHEDWEFSMYSWRSLRDAVKKIDQEVKEIESKETLNSFIEKIDSYNGLSIQDCGQIVRHGILRIGNTRQTYHVYLMEKVLFILKPVSLRLSAGKKNKRSSLSGAKLTIEYQISLNSQHVKAISTNNDLGGPDNFFRISYFSQDKSVKSIDCFAFNKELKKIWVDLLNSIVLAQDSQLNHKKLTKAEDLYQDLLSFIETEEFRKSDDSFEPPPLPPKDYFKELPPISKEENDSASTDNKSQPPSLDPISSNEPILKDDFISTNEDAKSLSLDSHLKVASTLEIFNQGSDYLDTSLSQEHYLEEPFEKDDAFKKDDANDSPLVINSSLGSEREEKEEDNLYNSNLIRLSKESVSDKSCNDEEFVSDQEYAKLLSAYQEKVAQVEDLKIQLSHLLKE